MDSDESLEATKKSNKILGCILKVFAALIVLLVIAGICIYLWQKDNIDAVMNAAKYSPEEIASQIQNSKENVSNALEAYNIDGIRDLTPEEEDALCRGNMTPEQAVALILGEQITPQNEGSTAEGTAPKAKDASAAANTGGRAANNDEDNRLTAVVTEYVGEMYALKAEYLGRLGSLASSVKAKYYADKAQVGKAKAVEIAISENLSTAAGLEAECDAKVEDLLGRFSAELEAIGADTSIVDTMRSEYQNEKSLKKSYYLSLKN